ncbi:MAG: hypothetical protein WBP59_00970 [Ilumatobacteraceae bacterium]
MSNLMRARWAAIGAAVAVTLGAGGIGIVNAVQSSGERATYVPITPCRLMDTRPDRGVPGRQTPLGAGQTHTQNTHGNNGQCTGVPNDATALALNVTALNATTGSYLTFYPTNATRPVAANLNPTPGEPPTPNSVITDISPTGQYTIYNFAGTVDIIIDINGYYVDHNHDDRYYTKAEVDARKSFSIDPMTVNSAYATVRRNGGLDSGLRMESFSLPWPEFDLGFSVPLDHTPNTPMTIEFTAHIDQTGCAIQLRPAYSSISRPGFTTRTNGVTSPLAQNVPSPANTSGRIQATVTAGGFGLAAGDAVLVTVRRETWGCNQPVYITGIRVVYT